MKKFFLLAILVLFFTSNSYAFDKERPGVLIGFGAGLSYTSYNHTVESGGVTVGNSNTVRGGAVNYKIGYAPNNQMEICYSNFIAFYEKESEFIDNVMIQDSFPSINISYFLSENLASGEWVESSYVTAGYGFSLWEAPYEIDSFDLVGRGYMVGVGYEFNKNSRVEINLLSKTAEKGSDKPSYKTDSTIVMLSFNVMFY